MTVQACPECDSTNVYQRSTKTPPWRCSDCGEEFGDPIEREVKAPGPKASRPSPRPVDFEATAPALTYNPELATPDVLLALVDAGDKLKLETDGGTAWKAPWAVEEVHDRVTWDVPGAGDWCDATIDVAYGGLHPNNRRARIEASPDGTAHIYNLDDEGEAESISWHGDVLAGVEKVGEVSVSSRMQYLVDDSGRGVPEGDDSWRNAVAEVAHD